MGILNKTAFGFAVVGQSLLGSIDGYAQNTPAAKPGSKKNISGLWVGGRTAQSRGGASQGNYENAVRFYVEQREQDDSVKAVLSETLSDGNQAYATYQNWVTYRGVYKNDVLTLKADNIVENKSRNPSSAFATYYDETITVSLMNDRKRLGDLIRLEGKTTHNSKQAYTISPDGTFKYGKPREIGAMEIPQPPQKKIWLNFIESAAEADSLNEPEFSVLHPPARINRSVDSLGNNHDEIINPVLFRQNSDQLFEKQDSLELEHVVWMMKKDKELKISIAAHANEIPNNNPLEDKTSEKRAIFVENFLTDRGVNPDRIVKPQYFGADYLLADPKSAEGEQNNNRVDIAFIKAKAKKNTPK